MSILIQGMDIPLRCINCPFETYYHGKNRCLANRGKTIEWEIGHDRGRDCPLVPLQEKHGRLIDADSLLNQDCDVLENHSFADYIDPAPIWGYSREMIENAPTIVEAEGGTE